MTIETPYDIGQEVFIRVDGEWWKCKILAIYQNETDLFYEVHVDELYQYFRLPATEITMKEPDGYQNNNEFLDLFPEFNEHEKDELKLLIRRLRKQAAKRTELNNKKGELTP